MTNNKSAAPCPQDPRPKTYNVAIDPLPPALRPLADLREQWVVWKWEWKWNKKTGTGEWTKPPFRASNPKRYAKSNDTGTWGDYADACRAVAEGKADGIGFMLLGIGLCAFDLDHCRDGATGTVAPWAQALLDEAAKLGAYVEITVSGTGFRIIGEGSAIKTQRVFKLPEHGPDAKLELYRSCEKYITISGAQVGTCEKLPDDLDAFFDAVLAQHDKRDVPNISDKLESNTNNVVDLNGEPLNWAQLYGCELEPWLEELIEQGVPVGERSDQFHHVVCSLLEQKWTREEILARLQKSPKGIAAKYHNDKRLPWAVDYSIDMWRKNENQADPEETDPSVDPKGELFDPWAQFIVPNFPLDVLPPIAREFVVSQAEVIGVDQASMAMCVLATFSGALDHSFSLKMMRHGTWFVSPRLWVLLYGDASTKKTPTFNAATDPLEQHQKALQQDYKEELDEYEIACAYAQKEKGAEKPEKPEPPVRYVVWDTTIEKLGELLERSDRGLLVKRDEITGWLGSMDQYGSNKGGMANRAFWLKAHDGGNYGVDRVGHGERLIDNLGVSLLAGVQPERMAELRGLTSDGLVQRFIPVVMGLARLPIDRPSDIHGYDELVRSLINAQSNVLTLSDPALEVMDELRKHLHELAGNAGGLARGFQSFLVKLQGYAGTLALILHMAADPQDGAAKPVERRTAEGVQKLVIDFILPHAFEFYRSAESNTNGDRLKRLASWILTNGQSRFVVSDLTSNVADFRGLELFEVNKRVSPLVAGGWIVPGDPKLGPMNRSWNVNPAVFTQFATRVKEEEASKAKLAELMNSPRRSKQ